MKKFGCISLLVILAVGAVIFYIRFYYVFGEGVKAGQLNQVMYKGRIFKTYEGKMIQVGLRSKTPGSMESYEFEFSINDPEIAQRLMMAGGKEVELHYHEYFGAIPWRGNTKYVVDSIVAIRDSRPVQYDQIP